MTNSQLTNFRFSTNILKRLGEELNPSPSQGLIELVKNAYDADALQCVIELADIDTANGRVLVTDNGDGMDTGTIMNGWLVLGKSGKQSQGLTKLGRRPSGDKGLGRLAALRMGSRVLLRSVPREDQGVEHRLTIDWERYGGDALVEDVELTIETRQNLDQIPHGVQISLENMRHPMSRAEVRRLARAMILLADPFGDNPVGFVPVLKAPEYQDLEAMVGAKYFGDSDFHLRAGVGKDGLADAVVTDRRGTVLFSAPHADIRQKGSSNPYECPACGFDLWVFILDADAFTTRTATIGDVKEWLQELGGVHFYYNGLRVSPYGDKGDDWLGLNLARVRSPELRPSTNTAVGRIAVLDEEARLLQKTDRSGFVANEPFQEIHRFATDTLNWMATRRLEVRENRRQTRRAEAPKKAQKERQNVQEAISVVPQESRKPLEAAFARYDQARDGEVKELHQEVQLYRTLSTVGIASATFAHESANNPLKLIQQSITTVRFRCQKYVGDMYDLQLKDPIERILQSVESVRVLANVTLSLLDHEKRRPSRVDVHTTLESVIKLYQPFIQDRDTQLSTEFCEGKPCVRGNVAAIESIISNLLNNSLIAFEKNPPGKRLIVVRTLRVGSTLELRVLDNGPGIQGISKNNIWLPGQTTRPNGTGLGLTIVKDTVSDLGGVVDAVENGEYGGAEIIIRVPLIGV